MRGGRFIDVRGLLLGGTALEGFFFSNSGEVVA